MTNPANSPYAVCRGFVIDAIDRLPEHLRPMLMQELQLRFAPGPQKIRQSVAQKIRELEADQRAHDRWVAQKIRELEAEQRDPDLTEIRELEAEQRDPTDLTASPLAQKIRELEAKQRDPTDRAAAPVTPATRWATIARVVACKVDREALCTYPDCSCYMR
jgi:hypothetical protein